MVGTFGLIVRIADDLGGVVNVVHVGNGGVGIACGTSGLGGYGVYVVGHWHNGCDVGSESPRHDAGLWWWWHLTF